MLRRPRDARAVAGDVSEMRTAIADEKGEADPWDFKYAAGGLIDIEFVAQYLQLVYANTHPEIIDTSTSRTLEKAARAGVLKAEDADVLRPAEALFRNLTQILRLCLPGAFDPKTANAGVLRFWRAPPTCRIFRRCRRTSLKRSGKFVRVLKGF